MMSGPRKIPTSACPCWYPAGAQTTRAGRQEHVGSALPALEPSLSRDWRAADSSPRGACRAAALRSIPHADHEGIEVRCLQLVANLVQVIEFLDRADPHAEPGVSIDGYALHV